MIFVEHTKLFINTLFGNFPRDVGFPARRIVNSLEEFLELAHIYHSTSPVFISLYNIDCIEKEVEIRCLWIDFDSRNQYKLMKELKTVHARLIDLGFHPNDIVPAFTGDKGFHIYAKINPRTYTIDNAKTYLNWIISYLCRGLETPDSPLFSDVNRIVRVAGIQRKLDGSFMLSLSPKQIFKYDTINDYFIKHKFAWKKLIWIGSRYLQRMNGGADLELGELKDEIKSTGFKPPSPIQSINNPDKTSIISPITKKGDGEYFDFLKLVLEESPLFYAIHAPNPRHIDRVRLAIKLIKLKLPLEHCGDIMESLRWIDWDLETTMYQLNHIRNKYNL